MPAKTEYDTIDSSSNNNAPHDNDNDSGTSDSDDTKNSNNSNKRKLSKGKHLNYTVKSHVTFSLDALRAPSMWLKSHKH
jgi:hypothetical protein